AEAKKKMNKLDADASGRIILLRTLLSPYEEDVTRLDGEKIKNEATELSRIIDEMRVQKDRISRMERDLE
ncbi:MAG TPA: hypothetical protein PKO06_24405, partial [Candidatus Ozemobacteraceae bacterium]|nr:hypothetical protein [Candidatus Ozemobacteraceae bacterium]